MEEIFKIIQTETSLHHNTPLDVSKVIDAQKKLVKEGFPMLPSDVIDFLKTYNGVKGDGCAILGIDPQDHMLDIFAFNKLHNNSSDTTIIGYDDFGFLVYDSNQSLYVLLDRQDGQKLDDFDDLSYALSSILHF